MIKKYNQYITEAVDSLYSVVEDYFLDYIETKHDEFDFYLIEATNGLVVCTFRLSFLHKTNMTIEDLDTVNKLFTSIVSTVKQKIDVLVNTSNLEYNITMDGSKIVCSFSRKSDTISITDCIPQVDENAVGISTKKLKQYFKDKYNLTLKNHNIHEEPSNDSLIYVFSMWFDEIITDDDLSGIRQELSIEYTLYDDQRVDIVTRIGCRGGSKELFIVFYPYLHVQYI